MIRLITMGAASLALYALALLVPSWGREFTRFLPLYGGLFVLYAAASWTAGRGASLGPRELRVVWIGAVLFRLCALFAEPTLSDDLYRYIWDGRVLLSGVNPYRYAPEAVELIGLRDALWPFINNPSLVTIYPPFLQLVFAGVAAVAPTVVGIKTAMLVFDLGAGWFLMRALKGKGLPPVWVCVYLWNPLLVIEFSGQGHADAVGVFFLAVALNAWARDRAFVAGIGLTLAALVKFLPVVALPLLLWRLKWRWLAFPILIALFYLPFRAGGVDPLGSLRTYAALWRSNDLVFGWIHGDAEVTKATLAEAKRMAAYVPAAVWVIAVALRRAWPSVFAWTVGTALLVSPVVHPWYVTWLLPVILFVPHPAWWVWSGTAILAYQPMAGFLKTGVWTEKTWIKGVEYWPVLVLVAVQVVLEWRLRGWPRNKTRSRNVL